MNFSRLIEKANLQKKDYQQQAVDWVHKQEQYGEYTKGGILADEMGLGKTIVMIGAMIQNFKRSTLLVVPFVLLQQWKDQIFRVTGHECLVYHGTEKNNIPISILRVTPIVLTTYQTLLSDVKTQKKLSILEWDRIICDEAHHMRNKYSRMHQEMLNMKSKILWLVTGTPIQNKISDLYSLFDLLKISNKLYLQPENLKTILKTCLLKRSKIQVGIDLPENINTKIICPWSNEKEMNLTQDVHENINNNKNMILAMMLYERMLCIYPRLVEKHLEKLKVYGLIRETHKVEENYLSKIEKVISTIVERKDNLNKKIIFASYHEEIDYLKKRLTENHQQVASLDGRLSKKAKKNILEEQHDILIIQIKTGNEGLNLQAYNEIYFMSPDWNPQVENQAIARCHRIGQTKPVYVFKFIMDGFAEDRTNIEQYTEKIQDYKLNIENETIEQIT